MTPDGQPERRPTRWAVVGGGMLGMTLAHRLAEGGSEVTLFEASPGLGGLASAWRLGDVVWDRYYHVTLLSDSHLRAVLGELGLEPEIRWEKTLSGCWADGRIYPFNGALELLRFPPLRFADRVRVGATIARAASIRDGRRLEDVLVADWLERWSGKRAFQRLWLPLLRAKLGESYRQTSATFVWTVVRRLWSARRRGMTEMFGYVSGGYARVADRFGAVLEGQGVKLALGTPVRRVERRDGQLFISHGEEESGFDRVVLTVVPSLAAKLCPGLSVNEQASLAGIPYVGIVCSSLLLERSLSNHYLTYLADDAPFSAVVEMTALVRHEELNGHALVYLPRYLAPGDPFLTLPDDEVEAIFLDGLARIYPDFEVGQLLAMRTSRARDIFAIPTVGQSGRALPVTTSVPGLYLVNSSQIRDGTLNVNETVALAERAAARLTDAP